MDPNQTLEELREAYAAWARSEGCSVAENEAAERMAVAFKDLDDWLTRGGYSPREWQDGRA